MNRFSVRFTASPDSVRADSGKAGVVPSGAPASGSPETTDSGPKAGNGQQQATTKQLAQLEDSLHHILESIEQLQQQQRQSLEELQQAAVELSVAAARWLLGVAIDAGMFAVDDLVRRAIERLQPDGPVSIRLNPNDLKLLQSLMGEDNELVESVRTTLVADMSLQRGSVRVESGRRLLITDLESRLEDIRRMWLESLDASQTERRKHGKDAGPLRRFPERRETA